MRRINVISAFLVGSVSLITFAPSAEAQTVGGRDAINQWWRDDENSRSALLRNRFPLQPIRLAPTIADRAPYTEWKTHLGPAADALVTAQATLRNHDTGETVVQKATGIIVRCDGLVMLPARLFHVPTPPGKVQVGYRLVDLTLSALPVQGKGVPTTWTAMPPRFSSRQIPYVLVKARDMHFRAAALLHPRNVTASRRVEVIFPRNIGTEEAGRLEVGRVKARIVQKNENDVPFLAFDTDTQTPVPPGAVVVDTESSMVLGLLAPSFDAEADAFAHPTNRDFTLFDRFHDLSNAIGLVPKPDDRITESETNANAKKAQTENEQANIKDAGEAQEGMVWIPGGPLAVRTENYPEVMGANIVCVPGFWIDRAEVTVSQYRAFLKVTNYRPLPRGWTEADVTGSASARSGDWPVHGVSSADAEAYADWAGKRLVTPIEWEWASRGAGSASVTAVNIKPVAEVRQSNNPLAPTNTPLLAANRGGHLDLRRINLAVAASGAPWPYLYDDVINALEMNLRWIGMTEGYREAKFWGYWQAPPNPKDPSRKNFRLNSVFADLVDFATPASTVINQKYTDAVETHDNMSLWSYALTPVHNRITAADDFVQMAVDMFNPLAIEKAGSREYDRSYFDVRDIGTNVPEWLQANRASRPDERVEKILLPLFDPDTQPNWQSIFRNEVTRRMADYNVMLNGGNHFNFPAVKSKITFSTPEDVGAYADWYGVALWMGPRAAVIPRTMRTGTGPVDPFVDREAMYPKLAAYPTRLLPFASLTDKENAPDFGTGFRCAR